MRARGRIGVDTFLPVVPDSRGKIRAAEVPIFNRRANLLAN